MILLLPFVQMNRNRQKQTETDRNRQKQTETLEPVQFSTGWSAVYCQTEAFRFCCFAKVVLCAAKSLVEASSHSAATSKALGQEFFRTHRGQQKQEMYQTVVIIDSSTHRRCCGSQVAGARHKES